jgi:Tfp pilus assembly protein PilX
MNALIVALVVLAIVALIALSLSVKVVTQYQRASTSPQSPTFASSTR